MNDEEKLEIENKEIREKEEKMLNSKKVQNKIKKAIKKFGKEKVNKIPKGCFICYDFDWDNLSCWDSENNQ